MVPETAKPELPRQNIPVFLSPQALFNPNSARGQPPLIMLEYWYREKRTLSDFRRGPLGPYFDGFAAHLKTQQYSQAGAVQILSKGCQFNAFLIAQRITRATQISPALVEAFLDVYTQYIRTAAHYSPRAEVARSLKRLCAYLADIHVYRPPKPQPHRTLASWLLEPYLRYLRQDCQLAEVTVQRARTQVGQFLAALGRAVRRPRLKTLGPETVERYLRDHLTGSPENCASLTAALRRFFRYCAARHYLRADYSGLIPPVRQYRYASLPKGIEDSALNRMLQKINTQTAIGARDYAMILLMMAYGLRALSVAHLLLEDIDWRHSRLRIRAEKGGKEVLLPLLEPVGEALIRYLRHRPARIPFREVFLTCVAPCRPLRNLAISRIVRDHLLEAGIQVPGVGARSLRHSWAIRALAHSTPIKSIADVLGHRYIDTTFIYAKADLNSLREVAMPWPQKH